MSITQIVADGRPGGGTVMVLALVADLLARGVEASLITDRKSYAADAGRRLGATVEEIPFFAPSTVSRLLASTLDRLRPSIVHAHGSRAGFHLAPWARRHREVATHYTVHGYHFHHRAWPRRLLGRWAERRTGRALHSVIHVCDYDRRLAERWRLVADEASRRVIYNGVDLEAVPPARPAEPPRVVFVGRLVAQKAPELIAAIAAELAASEIDSTLVGGGDAEPTVRRRLQQEIAAGRVTMTGAVGHQAALAALAQAAVLVLPSRWEGLPVVVLEALAMGVPVVAAAVGGIPEIISDGEIGILIESRRARDYADAVRGLLADRGQQKRLSDNGRLRVRERFTLADCLGRYAALYS